MNRDPDAPVPYWPAYLPDAAQPGSYWLTPRAEAELDEPEAGG